MPNKSDRAGKRVTQLHGELSYPAFIPAPLPPNPPIEMDAELLKLLSDADRALGRLDGASELLPNPDLFVAMYVRHEAVLSSQIEGTQSTLEDILAYESQAADTPEDALEVVNYVVAMRFGLKRLADIPVCVRMIKELHRELLNDVRGQEKNPGEFRKSQNWIGPANTPLANATFVPPPPDEMLDAVGNLERFIHDHEMPELIHAGIAHAQFETIHPFLDGNGRVGRLLITLMLCERRVLKQPLLYISYYLKAHKQEYYDRLMAIRNEGDWEGWLKFFLRGVYQVSQAATRVARDIVNLREEHRRQIQEAGLSAHGLAFLDFLYAKPDVSITRVAEHLSCTYPTANKLVLNFEKLGIVREVTGQQRNRRYRYSRYVDLFQHQALVLPSQAAND